MSGFFAPVFTARPIRELNAGLNVLVLKHSGYPSLHARFVGDVVRAKKLLEPCFILQHAAMEPDRAAREYEQPKPRPQSDRQPEQENEMPEIHRIACETIGPCFENSFRRHVHAGAAAGTRLAVAPDQVILCVPPPQEQQAKKQRPAPPRTKNRRPPPPQQFECRDGKRTENKRLHRRAAEPTV